MLYEKQVIRYIGDSLRRKSCHVAGQVAHAAATIESVGSVADLCGVITNRAT